MLALLSVAFAATPALPTVADWSKTLGPPSKPVALSERTRSEGEPVLVYWMQVVASPLGVGPALPGTLVANFAPASPIEASALHDFTFLAMADPTQIAALEGAVAKAGWVRSTTRVERAGGVFRDVALVLPDGRQGTLSIREGRAEGAMADGRPAPSLWMHVGTPTAG